MAEHVPPTIRKSGQSIIESGIHATSRLLDV